MAQSILFLLLLVPFAAATDHIVGANLGWNPNINYSSWANNQTFVVEDLISFRYMKHTYNVFEVNQTGYDNCTLDGLAGNWSSGKDFILLSAAKEYYFICNGYCLSGMKVAIRVHDLAAPPQAAAYRAGSSKNAAAGPAAAWFVAVAAVWIGIWLVIEV